LGRQSKLLVEIGAVYNGFCKPSVNHSPATNQKTATALVTTMGCNERGADPSAAHLICKRAWCIAIVNQLINHFISEVDYTTII